MVKRTCSFCKGKISITKKSYKKSTMVLKSDTTVPFDVVISANQQITNLLHCKGTMLEKKKKKWQYHGTFSCQFLFPKGSSSTVAVLKRSRGQDKTKVRLDRHGLHPLSLFLSVSVANKRRLLRAAGGPLRRRKPLHSSSVVNEVFSPESCAVYSSSIIALIFQSLFAQSDCCY